MGRLFLKSFFAGVMICIGGLVYLMCSNEVIGALLFTVGLYTILSFNLALYTGKVGYIVESTNKKNFLIELFVIWCGNFIGCWFVSLILKTSNYYNIQISDRLMSIYLNKINEQEITALVLSTLCGVLMFIAVKTFQKYDGFEKYIGVFICVPVFILCKFEHSIANMFFLMLNEQGFIISKSALTFIIICTIGNAIGAITISKTNKIINGG